MPKCPHCLSEVKRGANTCPSCGKRIITFKSPKERIYFIFFAYIIWLIIIDILFTVVTTSEVPDFNYASPPTITFTSCLGTLTQTPFIIAAVIGIVLVPISLGKFMAK